MDNEIFDDFLNEATWAVRDLWEKVSKTKIKDDELYALNDVLTQFFADKKG